MKQINKAVFLDRDGVIFANEFPDGTTNYNQDPDNLVFEIGALEGLKLLHEAGWLLVVITNQGGLEAGYITEKLLNEVHERMTEIIRESGAELADIRYCPHLHTSNCTCRKPLPFMIEKAAEAHGIDLSSSWMIGDMTGDILAGERAGCRTVILKTGFGGEDGYFEAAPDIKAENLLEAAKLILLKA